MWVKKRELISAYVQGYQMHDLEFMQLCCEKCKTMYNQDFSFMTPKVGNRQWQLMSETPETIKQQPNLKKMFGNFH